MICNCGCNKEIEYKEYHKYRVPRYIYGHNGGWGKRFKEKPESTNKFTGYWRIKRIISIEDKECELLFTNQCKGKLEIHHKDKNPCNNINSNISILCRSHHRLIEKGSITYLNPYSLFYTDSSGKRRYKKKKVI